MSAAGPSQGAKAPSGGSAAAQPCSVGAVMRAAGPSQGGKAPLGGSETGAAVQRGGGMPAAGPSQGAKAPLGACERLLRGIAAVTGWIALGFLTFMMVGTTVDALFRTAVGQPVPGLFELSELSMVMIVFMGLGWTQIDDAHIRVTLVRKWLPEAAGRVLDGFAWFAAALVLALLAYPATLEAIESVAIREFRWGYAAVPIWWAKLAVAFGLWFGAVHMLSCAVRALYAHAHTSARDPARTRALH